MESDKLQSLWYAYIQSSCDGDDVVDCPWTYAVEADDPARFRHYEDQNNVDVSPLSPLQFFQYVPLNTQSYSNVGNRLRQLAAEHSTAHPDKSLVKFKEICMVVEPKEQIISVPVIREKICIDKETRVSWNTCEKTALSGTHFVGSTGEIVFGIGDTQKCIEIKILNFTDKADDLHFTVEIPDYGGMYIPTPLTVTLKKVTNCFYPDEKCVLENLPRSLPISIDAIRFVLEGCLTNRTFHMALTHLCSTNNVVDVKLALAFELTRLCYQQRMPQSAFNTLKNYFKNDDIGVESLQN